MEPEGVIAVLRGDDPGQVESAARAVSAGGVRFVEVTFTVPGAEEVIGRLSGLEAVVGAGTLTDLRQAERALAAGARFLVCPACLPEIADRARKAGVPCLLGAMTPTEVLVAWNAGKVDEEIADKDAEPANLDGDGLGSQFPASKDRTRTIHERPSAVGKGQRGYAPPAIIVAPPAQVGRSFSYCWCGFRRTILSPRR